MRIIIFLLTLMLFSCGSKEFDLAIENINVFDSENGVILRNKSILINADTIVSVIPATQKVSAKKNIKGLGRLVTPGFIDTHIHLVSLFGDYENAPEYIPKDSVNEYRKRLSDTYLKYGVTTIREVGQPANWVKTSLDWQYDPLPNYPDIYICGGAIISDEEREPYIGHIEVESPEAVQNKIQEYHDMGIRHVKLYWRLRQPELAAAIQKAHELQMNVTGHVDQNVVSLDSALNLGLRHFEHIHTLAMSVFKYNEHFNEVMIQFDKNFMGLENDRFFAFMMSFWQLVERSPKLANQLDELIARMAENEITLSTSIHLFAEKFGMTYFTSDTSALSDQQKIVCREAFNFMMLNLKKAHDLGVKLTIGTDSKDGGKAALSEMLLLHEAGLSTAAILKIATINGAEAIGLTEKYGSISPGKKANLIIFEKSPFEDHLNFLSDKLIIKDGKIFNE